jgi:hypothetical protein
MQRILVVDDEAPIRRALETNLRARGYDVDLAATVAVRDVRDLLDLYELDDTEQRELLLAIARDAKEQRGWWTDYEDVLPARFETYVGLVAAFWSAALDRPVDPDPSEYFASIGMTAGDGPAWYFIRVPDGSLCQLTSQACRGSPSLVSSGRSWRSTCGSARTNRAGPRTWVPRRSWEGATPPGTGRACRSRCTATTT